MAARETGNLTLEEALNGQALDVFASSKLVEETRQAWEQAKAELTSWLEMTDVLTKDELAGRPRRRNDWVAENESA